MKNCKLSQSVRLLFVAVFSVIAINAYCDDFDNNGYGPGDTWTDMNTGIIYRGFDRSSLAFYGYGPSGVQYWGSKACVVGVDERYVKSGSITIRSEVELPSIVYSNGKIEGYETCKVVGPIDISSSKITSIKIPNTITSLGVDINCQNLESLQIPESVSSIGGTIKAEKLKLTIPENVNLPGKLDVSCAEIEFLDNFKVDGTIRLSGDNLCKVKFGENFNFVAGQVTIESKILESLEIPNGIKTIRNLKNKNYSIADLVLDCPNLKSVTIPKSVQSVGGSESPFENLIESVFFKDDVTEIVSYLFKGCTNLKYIHFSPNTKIICESAFENCTSLVELTLPDGVEKVLYKAFRDCTGLTKLTIPNSVKYLEGSSGTVPPASSFAGCINLKDIYVSWEDPINVAGDLFPFGGHDYYPTWRYWGGIYDSATLHLVSPPKPMGDFGGPSKFKYKRTSPWKFFRHIEHGGGYIRTFNIIVTATGNGKVEYDYWPPEGAGSDKIETQAGVCEIMDETKIFKIETNWIPMEDEFTFVMNDGATLESVLVNGEEKIDEVKMGSSIDKNKGILTLTNILGPTTIEVKFSGSGTGPDIGNGNITFADKKVEEICLKNWDANGDGVLSMKEAAAVKKLGSVFERNAEITSFDELQYFTGLESISGGTFYKYTNLRSVKLPESLTDIGISVFLDCSSLESIEIPDAVKTIGYGAFDGCRSLASLSLGKGVTSIGESAFMYNNALKNLIIPNQVQSIGESAFYGWYSLETLTIGSGVKEIGDHAFQGSERLTTIISKIDQPFEISNHVFSEMAYSIATLYVPVGKKSAYQTVSSWNLFNIEEGTNPEIADDEVIIVANNWVREYGEENPQFDYFVFSGTIKTGEPSLTCSATATSPVGTYDIVVSKGTVGNSKVHSKHGTLTITKAPLTISAGDYTKYEGEDNPTFKPTFTGFKNNETGNVLIKQPTITTTATKSSPVGSYPVTAVGAEAQNYDITYKNGTLTITEKPVVVENITFADAKVKAICVKNWDTNVDGELSEAEAAAVTDLGMVFKGNGDITSFNELEYFTGLTSLPNNTFRECSKLASIVIPANVTDLGTYHPFFYCSALRKVRVAEGNSKYDSRNDCNGIIETAENMLVYGTSGMTIPSTVTSIGNAAFANNPMTSITIPNSIKTIGAQAFVSCENLTSLVIPASVTNMYTDSFLGCSALTSISVESGNKAFDSRDNCNAIIYTSTNTLITGCKTTVIPTSVTKIGDAAFAMQKSLASIELPENITSIGKNAFWQCTSLAKVRIPSTVTSIGEFAFEDCYSLTEVHSDISIPFAINDNVFTTYSTTTLYAPAGKKNLYETTAGWKNFLKIEEMRVGDVITVTAKNYTRQYGEANPTFEFDVKGGMALGNATVSCEATATSPVGTYPIVISKGDIANSEVTLENGTLTITKAPLTITAKSYSRKQGEENPKFEVEYSGFKNKETESVLTKKPTVTTKATADSEPGEYDIVVAGAEAQNYELHYVNGKLTVEKRPTITEDGAVYEITEPDDGREAGVAFEDGLVVDGEYEIPSTINHEGENYTVTGIGAGAFNDNTALIQITIPETVIYIDCGAFTGCRNLAVIIVYAEQPISFRLALTRAGDYGVFEGVDKEKCVLYVPDGSVNAYKGAEGWSEFKQIQPITALGINGLCQDDRTFDVYNLQGRKVLDDAKNLDGLPKGVYIVNGRKIVK